MDLQNGIIITTFLLICGLWGYAAQKNGLWAFAVLFFAPIIFYSIAHPSTSTFLSLVFGGPVAFGCGLFSTIIRKYVSRKIPLDQKEQS